MDQEKLAWLASEYLSMWKQAGIALSEVTSSDNIMKTLSRSNARQTSRSASTRKLPNPSSLNDLNDIRSWIGDCKRCRLCEERKNIVFGVGNAQAKLMFVGEGPGADEDTQGVPFVGRAGQLLNKIIEAMGLKREDVYIANVVKCRPPQNRTPLPDEIEQCSPFLKAQVEMIRPSLIVTLGLPAATTLLGQVTTMGAVRGKFHKLVWDPNITVMPTYHPAYLLRNPSAKGLVWTDMKLVLKELSQIGPN